MDIRNRAVPRIERNGRNYNQIAEEGRKQSMERLVKGTYLNNANGKKVEVLSVGVIVRLEGNKIRNDQVLYTYDGETFRTAHRLYFVELIKSGKPRFSKIPDEPHRAALL